MKSRLDLRNLLNPKTTPSPIKNGNGSRKLERELTIRLQVKLTRKNSINSPTLSSINSVSVTSPEKKKQNNEHLFIKTSKFFQLFAEGT